MFTKFLSKVKAFPPRTQDWTNRLGPVALFGANGTIPHSASRMLQCFDSSPKDCDHYAELTIHNGTEPIEAPPETVAFLPTLHCGLMEPTGEAQANSNDWYMATTEAASDLMEKGYTVVHAGGDASATLPMIESYKRIHPSDEVILIHFSAFPTVGDAMSPVRLAVEKRLVKGVISVANRCVSAEERKFRRLNKMVYMDAQAIFSKGIFCIRDIRNDFPVFLSIDMSVLDPVYAPGVHMPCAGGLTTRELLHILNGIRAPRVAGVHIHGYNPSLDVVRQGDGLGLTQIAATKILQESILKTYTVSTATEQEGIERMKVMQRQGVVAENPYPEF